MNCDIWQSGDWPLDQETYSSDSEGLPMLAEDRSSMCDIIPPPSTSSETFARPASAVIQEDRKPGTKDDDI